MKGNGDPREILLVGTSIAVAGALAWASWLVGHAPDELAEAEVASTARLVLRDLREHWDGLRHGDGFRVFSDGSIETLAHKAAQAAPPPRAPHGALQNDPLKPRPFVALFRESERLAKAGDPTEASAALREAREAGTIASDEAAIAGLEVRIAVAAGDADELSQAWDQMLAQTPWSAVRNGRPVRLVSGWLAAAQLDPARAAALRQSVTAAGLDYIVGPTTAGDQVERSDAGLVLLPDLPMAATVTMCQSIWPGTAQVLRDSPAWARRTLGALEWPFNRDTEASEGAGESSGWSLVVTKLGLAATHHGQRTFLVDEAAFPDRLRDALPLPAGFSIDLASRAPHDDSASPLLDPVELSGSAGSIGAIQLYHSDPGRLVRTGAKRRRMAAWLLLALGAVTVAAAVIAARAQRRERRLAELRSTFVAGISHDLRTPLASIMLMAENLQSRRVGHERTAEYAAGITTEAARLRRRVDDILDFARIERGEPAQTVREDVRLPELVADILEHCEDEASRAELRFDGMHKGLCANASVDADALRRITGNLAQNALRHSGGSCVTVRFTMDQGALKLTVDDDGRGIPAKDRARVLTPFERLDEKLNAQGGTGLGLAIVAGLVDALHGSLTITDAPDSPGARFTVQLPLDES